MTMTKHTLSDIDLLAYVDGLLDDDPARKAAIEELLGSSPADAARVHAWQAQNAALRRRYGDRIHEPVPDRLYTALAHTPGRRIRRAARIAAVALLTAGATAGGWFIGQREQPGDWSAQVFLQHSYDDYVTRGSDAATARLADAGDGEPMHWLTERISLSLRAPDLTSLGFSLAGKQTVSVGGDQMVRLTYSAADGTSFALFLRPRWDDPDDRIRVTRQNAVSLAYWVDGPLASAIAARLPRSRTLEIADAVRRAMQDPQVPGPEVRSAPTGTLADGELATRAPALDQPLTLEPSAAPGILTETPAGATVAN